MACSWILTESHRTNENLETHSGWRAVETTLLVPWPGSHSIKINSLAFRSEADRDWRVENIYMKLLVLKQGDCIKKFLYSFFSSEQIVTVEPIDEIDAKLLDC